MRDHIIAEGIHGEKVIMEPVGKKKAGRLFRGKTWDGIPQPTIA
jgi:hypothetical protein